MVYRVTLATAGMDAVSHFEIPYDNKERAQKFYRDVFGWQFAKVPDIDYDMITTTESDAETMMPKKPGAINGGMMARHVAEEYPTITISVDSIDDRLKEVEESGGRITLQKMQIGEYGLYAQIADTERNIIALWQPLHHHHDS